MLKKIISGGQPGVEIAALDAALKLDIPHGGWAYKRVREGGGLFIDPILCVKTSKKFQFA